MFEKFSASAIQAINAAREEALRLEFNQVDTDHLLLGLAHENQGVVARAFRLKGFELRALRLAVEQRSGRGYSLIRMEDLTFTPSCLRAIAHAARANPTLVEGQDLFAALIAESEGAAVAVVAGLGLDPLALVSSAYALGRSEPTPDPASDPLLPSRFGFRLLTPTGEAVLGYALAATRMFGHTFVGTEQLLGALVNTPAGLAARVLAQNGVQALEVEAVLARAIGRGSGTLPGRLALSRWSEEVLGHAWQEARRLGHTRVGSGHILLALLDLDVGGALYILDQLNVNLAQIRDDVLGAFAAAPDDPEPAADAGVRV